MRILFTSTPGWGHLHPMIGLARAFLDRGDEVQWVTGADAAPRLAAAGFAVDAGGLGEREGMAELDRQFPELRTMAPAERPAYTFPRLFGAVRAAAMLDDLLPIARAWRPDLLVCEAGALAGPIAAAVLGVPNLTHAFGGLLPAPRVAAAGVITEPLWTAQGLAPRPYAGCYDHVYLDIYPPSLQGGPRDHVPVTQLLRPEAHTTGADEPLPAWVTAGGATPLVYVTFGTVFANDVALRTVVDALEAIGTRAVVTVGPHGDLAAPGPRTGEVHVAHYVPQGQLLPHCSLVVSHAGSGTFLAALGAEIPQLCLPQAADQFLNAAAAERAGVGIALPPGGVSVDAVRDAVARLLAEPAFRAASRTVGRELATMPDAHEVADRIHVRFG